MNRMKATVVNYADASPFSIEKKKNVVGIDRRRSVSLVCAYLNYTHTTSSSRHTCMQKKKKGVVSKENSGGKDPIWRSNPFSLKSKEKK